MTHDVRVHDQPELMAHDLSLVLQSVETARGLPNPCYTSPSAYEIERQQVFAGGWACAAFAKDAPDPGDLFPFEFAGLPLLLVRGVDRLLRVFHNVCPHRGRVLVAEPSCVKKSVVCPYHCWSFGLDGALVATPHIGGPGQHDCIGFDPQNIRLREIRSAEWFGLVLVDLSGTAQTFASYVGPLAERWRAFADVSLVHTGPDSTIEFTLHCNWKLAVENYCEAYHLPWVHPGLNRYSPLDLHQSIVEESYSGQRCDRYRPTVDSGATGFPTASDLPPFWRAGAEYIALYPNVLLGIHRDHFYAVLVQPDGPARTRERFEIYYFDETVRGGEFAEARAANRKLWEAVFVEDLDAVEAMQRGRLSPGFDGGVFSPAMDPPTHAFHRWIARALLDGRQPHVVAAE